MTIVGPLLMALLFLVPILIATLQDDSLKKLLINDKSGNYKDELNALTNFKISYVFETNLDTLKSLVKKEEFDAFVSIGDSADNFAVQMYAFEPVGLNLKQEISNLVEKKVEYKNYERLGVDKAQIEAAKPNIPVKTVVWTEDGEKTSSSELNLIIGYIAAIAIYMFVFMYGVQVMRGVIEEKTNRIIEVIISSVKPFQLMAGKIIGIALVALTQFLLWVVLTFAIISIIQVFLPADMLTAQTAGNLPAGANVGNTPMSGDLGEILAAVNGFNWARLGVSFLFYFLGGYLLYAAMFAAIGAAVDNETDTQQFMLPVTIPLVVAIVAAQAVVQFPEGALAQWLSIIPFTSPVIMPIRMSLTSVPFWQLGLSIGLLAATFVGMTWLAGKIYRTGILMYGKKTSYKELWKWLKYS